MHAVMVAADLQHPIGAASRAQMRNGVLDAEEHPLHVYRLDPIHLMPGLIQ